MKKMNLCKPSKRYPFIKDIFYQLMKNTEMISPISHLSLSGIVMFGALLLLSFFLCSGLGCQSRLDRQMCNLQNKDTMSRILAVDALRKIDDERTIEPLIAALKDENPDVAWRAAAALGDKGDNRAVNPLISALRHNDLSVQHFAASSLVKIGAPAVEPLIAVIKNKNSDSFRTKAITLLGNIRDNRAVDPLILLLNETNSDEIRVAAAIALGTIGDKRAVEPLILVLKDSYSVLQDEAVTALVKIGKPAVEPLIAALKHESEAVRTASVTALGRIGDERAVLPLIEVLESKRLEEIWRSAESLGRIGDSRAVLPLMVALKNKDVTVQKSAAEALEKIGSPSVEPLFTLVKDNQDPVLKKSAMDVLVKIGEPAVKPLISFIATKQELEVKQSAIDVLVKIGEPAVEPLIAALEHESEAVRTASATALGRIGDERAIHALVEALTDRDIRYHAATALDSLEWEPVVPSNRIHYLYAKGKTNELLDEWELTKKTLLDDMQSGQKKSIQNAVDAFIDLKGNTIIPELIDILERDGNILIAQAYLDSEYQMLMDAAIEWANRHGLNMVNDSQIE
jgi:HEAT repeat protein